MLGVANPVARYKRVLRRRREVLPAWCIARRRADHAAGVAAIGPGAARSGHGGRCLWRIAACCRAIGRHVEEAVAMVDQIVGVADTARVNLHRRIGGKGVIAAALVGLCVERQAGDRGGIDAEHRCPKQALDPPQPTTVGCAHRAVAPDNQVQFAARAKGQAVRRVILA